MAATYWVAKYVEDQFRNETRNVGIIVAANGAISARFVGEREDGTIDRRRVQRFKYPNVYLQWIQYWREQIDKGTLGEAVASATANYFIMQGGEVSDIGDDSAAQVCNFLFSLLVSEEPTMDAFQLGVGDDASIELGTEIAGVFNELNLLGDAPMLRARHPIKKEERIRGEHAVHTPSFSQRNGRLHIYEAIDFGFRKQKVIKERAGWMAYMFSDIRHKIPDARSYSIFRPSREEGGETIEYAKAMLGSESVLVNWSDDNERKTFVNERQRLAEALP